MSDELTEQELAEMEARANAATPGPWLIGVQEASAMVHNEASARFYAEQEAKHGRRLASDVRGVLVGTCTYCDCGDVISASEQKYSLEDGSVIYVTWHIHFMPHPESSLIYNFAGATVLQDNEYETSGNIENDTLFTSHARTDVPRLIAEVRRLREMIQRQPDDPVNLVGIVGNSVLIVRDTE